MNPPPDTVTEVPTGPNEGERFIEVAAEDWGVMATDGRLLYKRP